VHVLGAAFKASLQTDAALMKTVALPLKPLVAARLAIWAALFVVYRAYRGFFVIVPAVSRELIKKCAELCPRKPLAIFMCRPLCTELL
jgi:hypothetical protein